MNPPDTIPSMPESPADAELLNQYVETGSRAALGQLIERYAGLVRASAGRQLDDAADADDVTQAVFMVLAKKASAARGRPLAGWLFNVTRYCVANVHRAKRRRTRHERQAARPDVALPTPEVPDPAIRLRLDDALASLRTADRDLLLTHFVQGRPFAAIGADLGLAEATARKRAARAIDRLRNYFRRHGITPDGTALTAALVAKPMVATQAIIIAATAAPGVTVAGSYAAQVIQMIGWLKVKVALAAVAVAAVVVSGGVAIQQARTPARVAITRPDAATPATAPSSPASPPEPIKAFLHRPTFADPGEGPPGKIVKVAARFDNLGRPVLVDQKLRSDWKVMQLPANDPAVLPTITLPADISTADAFAALRPLSPAGLAQKNQPTKPTSSPTPAGPQQFWPAIAARVGNFNLGGQADPNDPQILVDPRGAGWQQSVSAWGWMALDHVERQTIIRPPAWQFGETLTFAIRFATDPAIKNAFFSPPQFEGFDPRDVPKAPGYGVAWSGYSITAQVPGRLAANGVVPKLKGVLPAVFVYNTRVWQWAQNPGDNIAVAIDGLVVHFFNANPKASPATIQFGFIRQPGQSADWFTAREKMFSDWVKRVEVLGNDAHWHRLFPFSGTGSGETGSEIWTARIDSPIADGPMQLRWELPAVWQDVNVPFEFNNVQVPE